MVQTEEIPQEETPQPNKLQEILAGIQRMLESRKFWVLLAGLATVTGALVTNQIDTWQAVQAYIAALAVYSTGIAIVDGGVAAGKAKP